MLGVILTAVPLPQSPPSIDLSVVFLRWILSKVSELYPIQGSTIKQSDKRSRNLQDCCECCLGLATWQQVCELTANALQQICGCGHHRSSHAMMKSNRGTVIFEGERGSSVHAIKMKRILSQKRPVVNMEAEAGRLASTTRIPYTEAAIEGPLGDPMPVQSLSELRSFKGAREAEALHRVTKLSAMTMAASGSRLPEYPNV